MLRYKIILLFLLIVGIYSFSFVQAAENNLDLFGKVIYIDPGHGGIDPGAIYKDMKESEINLKISKKIASELEAQGAVVYLTRYDDYDLSLPNTINRKRSDLSRRGNIINNSNCDMYISIHLNSETSSSWYGAQVFYDDVNPDNQKIAQIIQDELKNNLRTTREIKLSHDIYLNKRVKRPGVLIEVGFISNPNERYLLKQDDYQQKVASTITAGIKKYLLSN